MNPLHLVGCRVGCLVGLSVGFLDGLGEGFLVGTRVGYVEGESEGKEAGAEDGVVSGEDDGATDDEDGAIECESVGTGVGDSVTFVDVTEFISKPLISSTLSTAIPILRRSLTIYSLPTFVFINFKKSPGYFSAEITAFEDDAYIMSKPTSR